MDISITADFGGACHDEAKDLITKIHSSLALLHGQLTSGKQPQCFQESKVTYNPEFGTFSIDMAKKSPVFDWVDNQIDRGTFDGSVGHRFTSLKPKRTEVFTINLLPNEADKVLAAIERTLEAAAQNDSAKPASASAHPHDCYRHL